MAMPYGVPLRIRESSLLHPRLSVTTVKHNGQYHGSSTSRRRTVPTTSMARYARNAALTSTREFPCFTTQLRRTANPHGSGAGRDLSRHSSSSCPSYYYQPTSCSLCKISASGRPQVFDHQSTTMEHVSPIRCSMFVLVAANGRATPFVPFVATHSPFPFCILTSPFCISHPPYHPSGFWP